MLLVQGRIAALQEAQRDGIGLLLDQRLVLPRHHKSKLALATMAIVILLAATKVLPIYVAALGGVLVLLASRALAFGEAGASLSLKVILLVAASFALGDALTITGATAWLASQLVAAAGSLEPRWILVLLMMLMGLLTNFVSNNAAAAIGTPLSIELARQLGVRARALRAGRAVRLQPLLPHAHGLPDQPAGHERRRLSLQRFRPRRHTALSHHGRGAVGDADLALRAVRQSIVDGDIEGQPPPLRRPRGQRVCADAEAES